MLTLVSRVGHDKVAVTATEQALFQDWEWMNPTLYKQTLTSRVFAIMSNAEALTKGMLPGLDPRFFGGDRLIGLCLLPNLF